MHQQFAAARPRPGVRAVAGLLLTALVAISACGGGGSGDDAGGPNEQVADPEGTLRLSTPRTIFTWDIHLQGNDTGPFEQYYMVYDPLVQLENDLTLSPRAATSWTTAADAMSAEFELRTDIVFGDGTRLDAAAVKANFDRAMTIAGSTVASSLAAMNLESVDVVATSTVRFNFSRPTYTFPFALSSEPRANFIMNPTAFADPEGLAQVADGSGPYKVASQTSDTAVTFERRDDYWDGNDTRPRTQVWTSVTDDRARLNTLQSGQADIVHLLPGTNTAAARTLAEQNPSDYQFHEYTQVKQNVLFLNTESGPFTDPAMRKAVNLAVDRLEFSQAFSDGTDMPTGQIFPSPREGYVEEIDDPDRLRADPEAATEVLEDAGIANPTIRASVPNATAYVAAAQVVQQNLAEAGITMTIDPTQGSLARSLFASGEYDMLLSNQSISADSSAVIRSDLVSTGLSLGGLLPYLEPIVDEILTMESGDARTDKLEELTELLDEEPVHVYMTTAVTANAANTRVGGLDDLFGSALFQGPATRDLTISRAP